MVWNRPFACSCNIKNYGLRLFAHPGRVSQGDAEQVFTTAAASPCKTDHSKRCGFALGQIAKLSGARAGSKGRVSTVHFTWAPVIYKGKEKKNNTAELVWKFFKPELIYLAGNVG